MQVAATPYDFPISGNLDLQKTALLIIDMQRDFCDLNGYMNTRGDDVSAARAIIPMICSVRSASASIGIIIIYSLSFIPF